MKDMFVSPAIVAIDVQFNQAGMEEANVFHRKLLKVLAQCHPQRVPFGCMHIQDWGSATLIRFDMDVKNGDIARANAYGRKLISDAAEWVDEILHDRNETHRSFTVPWSGRDFNITKSITNRDRYTVSLDAVVNGRYVTRTNVIEWDEVMLQWAVKDYRSASRWLGNLEDALAYATYHLISNFVDLNENA